MANHEPTYRIDPIEPGQIEARLTALLDRLEPVLDPDDVAAIRVLLERADHAAAFDLLDEITDAATTEVETASLVELVLIGQALRPD
jgi:hypothetical protein